MKRTDFLKGTGMAVGMAAMPVSIAAHEEAKTLPGVQPDAIMAVDRAGNLAAVILPPVEGDGRYVIHPIPKGRKL